ncbi:hypothetical protein LTR08_003725 [Meristemomyces frigidus]|nr:hypothetical protein LTR08_003725 [Meristemomyces frigidus]
MDLLLDNMASLIDSKKHCDFVISCEGRRFNVHKAVMCSASPALAAAFNVDMTESQTGTIEHTQYDADTVERMITYVYKTKYDLPGDTQITVSATNRDTDYSNSITILDGNAHLIAHTRMYAIGSYYHLPTLKLLAAQNFASCTNGHFETGNFIHVLREVNTHISKDDRDFRDVVRTLALDNLIPLTQDDIFMADLAELEDVQDFAAEMLRQVVQDRTRDRAAWTSRERIHVEQMLQRSVECALLRGQLEAEQAKSKADSEAASEASESTIKHLEGVMERLVDHLEVLPSECRNAGCDRVFGELRLERKGHPGRGRGEGDWELRCGRCRCRLCR